MKRAARLGAFAARAGPENGETIFEKEDRRKEGRRVSIKPESPLSSADRKRGSDWVTGDKLIKRRLQLDGALAKKR